MPPQSSPPLQHPASQQTLESRVRQVLGGLPLRRAPPDLAARVLAHLARRAALPWWRRSFRHWPTPAHAGFVIVCGALISLSLAGGVWLLGDVPTLGGVTDLPARWGAEAAALAQVVTDLASSLARMLPVSWIEGAAVLYAALFGLGAAAYRLLYEER